MEARLVLLGEREEASALAADVAAGHLDAAITRSGRASFMASGGTTPGAAYKGLSAIALDWSRVTIGLVDERWVPADHPASNERLIRNSLHRGPASASVFIPLKTSAATPADAVADRTRVYAPHCAPISCLLLGMGDDGHTASWFPGSAGLKSALYPSDGEIISPIDASGAPAAGDHPERMTLTAGPICGAETAILLIFGDRKRTVLEQSLKGDETTYPVRRAIDGLGRRLTIIWAP